MAIVVTFVLVREWRTNGRPSLRGAIPIAFFATAIGLIVLCGVAYL